MTTRNTRKRGLAAAAIAMLVASGIGASYAALNQTITDGAETHEIFSDTVDFGLQYTADSAVMDMDLTPDFESVVSYDYRIQIENPGDLPAHAAFYIDQDSIADLDLDDPIFTETKVGFRVFNGMAGGTAMANGNHSDSGPFSVMTLKEFLTTAYVSDIVIDPMVDSNYSEGKGHYEIWFAVYVPSIAMWTSGESEALDQLFGTKFTLNQIINGESPMVEYAKDNGTVVANGGGSYGPSTVWKIPAADMETITL